MFKRSLQVSVVKTPKSTKTETPETTPKVDYYAGIALESAREVVKGASALLATYMVADTLRKVTMHIVATKIR